MSSGEIVDCPGLFSCDGMQAAVGEVVRSAAEVRVRLANAAELRAEIVRSGITPNDYYVAFAPDEVEVTAAVAVDEDGRIIGEARRPAERIRSYRELRSRRRRS